ncbi:hypothetical protein BRD20_08625 [Halobacteriales archaeon SW_8_65_20]|nr:MAG: hypothetical protein BRD20_08625 [Halobacteriales archaeon SW_8_65_20]
MPAWVSVHGSARRCRRAGASSVIVAYLVVGDVADALSIGLVTNLVKTLTYYGYERLWDRIAWGTR